jgi:23S rRNA pseudouridine1911/1915/1917 synthase
MPTDRLALVAPADAAGQRADVVLGRHLPGLSRRVARSLALAGHLRVDGRPAAPAHRVTPGEHLELLLPEPAPATADPPALVILATTARFVYVAKPSGLHTHRLRPGDPPALADAVARVHPECAAASPDPRDGGAVHRLDRGTSGVVAFARDPAAFTAARAAFTAARVVKHYLALATCPEDQPYVWPPPAGPHLEIHADHLELTAPLGPGPQASLVAVRPDGQPSRTTLHRPTPLSTPHLLRCALILHTGRRHQARVHLAWLGLPILGDTAYGAPPADRLYLHARALTIPGEPEVEAPALDFPD